MLRPRHWCCLKLVGFNPVVVWRQPAESDLARRQKGRFVQGMHASPAPKTMKSSRDGCWAATWNKEIVSLINQAGGRPWASPARFQLHPRQKLMMENKGRPGRVHRHQWVNGITQVDQA